MGNLPIFGKITLRNFLSVVSSAMKSTNKKTIFFNWTFPKKNIILSFMNYAIFWHFLCINIPLFCLHFSSCVHKFLTIFSNYVFSVFSKKDYKKKEKKNSQFFPYNLSKSSKFLWNRPMKNYFHTSFNKITKITLQKYLQL